MLFSADGRALINLGASSGGSTEYNGYFAVVDDSDLSGGTPIYLGSRLLIQPAKMNTQLIILTTNRLTSTILR